MARYCGKSYFLRSETSNNANWMKKIPSVLISIIGYTSHYFIFSEDLSKNQQIWYQFCLTMIWVSYIIAIYKEPGSPPKNFEPAPGEWKRWCKKCQLYKPERAHHCKTCKKCVLKMDHHCEYRISQPHKLRYSNILKVLGRLIVLDMIICHIF